MAANIEQIFQDFILQKIREIEEQKEERGSEAAGPDREGTSPHPDPSESQRRQRKPKKHKSKKRRRNHEKESSSESGAEMEGERKHQPRKGTPASENKEQGEDHGRKSRSQRERSSGKKKKKKKKKKKRRRRRIGENTSDSDSETGSKQVNERLRGRQEQLPDIIPKQDSSNKGSGAEKRLGSRSPCSPSHSISESHSCSVKSYAPPSLGHHCQRSPSRSPPPSHCQRTQTSPSEKRGHLYESVQVNQCPSGRLQSPLDVLHSAHSSLQAEDTVKARLAEPTESPDQSENQGSGSSGPKQPKPCEPEQTQKPKASEKPSSHQHSPARRKRKQSRSPQKDVERKSSKRRKRSKSPYRSYRRRSRSRSHSARKRSRSRSAHRRSRRSRSRSASRSRRRPTYSQRDRWKRQPSHSPVLILRKKRSPPRKERSRSTSPKRISELDKEQLLEIAKANAAAMCVKAGMPVPASLRSTMLPLALPAMAMNAAMASMTAASVTAALSNMGTLSSLLPLSSISSKPAGLAVQPSAAALEEVKKKVAKQANSISIKEFTDKCKMIADSSGELPVALPHVSDDEDDGALFGGSSIREQKVINFNINNTAARSAGRSDADMAKEFPVSSGSQHRKKEGEGVVAYGEWVPVEKTADKAAATAKKATPNVPSLPAGETASEPDLPDVVEQQPAPVPDSDSVFPETRQQPVDISQAVTERIKAQRRLAENPYDISAICMLSRAQEQVDAWAQSSSVPGLFTGSTGAQVLSSEELSSSGPQAWLKKDQFLRAAPVSGGVGEFLMRKMGWRTGEGLGRNREGTVEPIVIDFKVDRKGLVAEGEKPQKQTGGLVVTKDLMGKHPVSALIELCNKKRIMQPDFVMVHHSGPDHRKSFLFKVTVNGVDYQPQTASPNKKHAKAMAATVALQALGEVPVDGPGLYTGPVFTAASTGPLFST
uniref:Protein SON n=1 Tax=Fundulus heteroclitus TaxID=8078 RepID=A0A3Q2PVN2_FUNHE